MIQLSYANKDMSPLQDGQTVLGIPQENQIQVGDSSLLQVMQNHNAEAVGREVECLPSEVSQDKEVSAVARLIREDQSCPTLGAAQATSGCASYGSVVSLRADVLLLRRGERGVSGNRPHTRRRDKAAPGNRARQQRILSLAPQAQLPRRVPNTLPQLQLGKASTRKMPTPKLGADHNDTICMAERLVAEQGKLSL